ncbi:MAG: hypothetical protein H7844_04620 [Nitrospirae bacterium YQR-1]
MSVFFVSIAILAAGGLIAGKYPKISGNISTMTIAAALIGNLFISIPPVFFNDVPAYTLYLQMPMGIVNFEVDSLSAFFLGIASLIFFLTSIYLKGYLPVEDKKRKFSFAFFNFLFISVMLVFTVKNSVGFLISLEFVTLLTVFLMLHGRHEPKVQKAAVYYLIAMHIGTVFLIIPVVMLIAAAGSMDFSTYKDVLASSSKLQTPLLCLFLTGFTFKAGFIPFHSATVNAAGEAHSAVPAIVASVIIQTAVYGILRIITLTESPSPYVAYAFLAISVITALYAVINSLAQRDLRQILSYSVISNTGVIGIGISAGMLGKSYAIPVLSFLGFTGALFHILNHALSKSTAFFACGSVYLNTGTCELNNLGGIIKNMPVTAFCFLAASASLCALPPFNGFVSEFFIYLSLITSEAVSSGGLITAKVMTAAALASVGALSLAALVRAFGICFQGLPRSEFQAKESSLSMLAPMVFMAAVCLVIGVFPMPVLSIIRPSVVLISGFSDITFINVLEPASSVSRASLVFLLLIVVIFGCRHLLLRKRTTLKAPTWNCGYENINERMQYSALSLSAPLVNLILPLVAKTETDGGFFSLKAADSQQIEDEDTEARLSTIIRMPGVSQLSKKDYFFPQQRLHHQTKYIDFIEHYIAGNIFKALNRFYNLFAWIQTGHIGHYLFYVLITLIALLIISLWRLL